MSRTIDERIVEMRFDNRQFERNVQTSLSTLDKLKQGLDLDGAAKGLENLGDAAKKCNMSALSSSVETVRAKFSALEVVAMTTLSNITNSALNTGKRLVSALTIDPIKSGFQEYETQIGAVQTILANTQHEGTNLQQVNRALDELNTYADKTIYNFTEMTRNIGTFTAAGVNLQTSVDSIKGIANLAAISGSTSQQASTAMYQLSQALAAGRVSLMDWNSVVNAGMGGKVFQDALVRTSELLGTGAQNAINMYGSFRESLTRGEWLTTEVLTETLKQFAGAYTEADLVQQGFTEAQAKEIAQMAQTAEDAATKVKTFTQLWDTLKESAQSGWTSTWEILVGDFEEAKELLTEISNTIGGVISESAQARNELLSGGLSSGWKQLLDQGIADEAGFIESIQTVARESGNAFDQLVAGSDSFTDALKQGLKDGVISSETLSEAVYHLQGKMSGMSQEERKAAGYTSEMVEQIETLADSLRDGSVSMDEFTEKILRPSGRENLIQSVWNAAKGLVSVIAPIKDAFRDIFPPATSDQLYALTETLRSFSERLTISDETADKLQRTFKGLFSMLDLGRQAIMAVVNAVMPMAGGIGSLADGLLTATAAIGDFLTGINDAAKKGEVFSKVAQGIADALGFVVSGIQTFIGFLGDVFAIPGFEAFQALLGRIQTRIGQVIDAVGGLGFGVDDAVNTMDSAVGNSKFLQMLQSLFNGVKAIASGIIGVLGGLSATLIDAIGNADFSGVIDLLNGISLGGIAVGITKFMNSLTKSFDDVGGLLDNVKGILDGVRGCFEAYQTQLKAGTLLKIASAIAVLAAAIVTISLIDSGKLTASLGAISIVPAAQATSDMIGEVIAVSSKGIDAWKDWVDEKTYYDELSLKDQLVGWENLQKRYKAGSEERKQIDREVYQLQNELVASTYQASLDWIEEEKYYNRLSTEEELAAYERMQSRYMEGSEERKKIDREVYTLRNQLVDESYQNSMDWIEKEKNYGRMSLADELAAYKRVQSRYAAGSKEREEMDLKVYQLEQEIYEAQKQYIADVQSVQESANQKRIQLEQEYADKVRSVNEQLERDIQSLNDQYQNAVESRTNSLYQSYGLFDEVTKKEAVSSDTLMKNLEGQVQEFGEWQDILGQLSARGVDADLISELQEMGPSAIEEIRALNSMSDDELEKYVSLWSVKHAQAREQATSELEGLRVETQEQIAQLRADAEAELEEYRITWQEELSQLEEDTADQLASLRQEFAENVGLIKKDTEAEMREMTEAATKILKEAGWTETGQQIPAGLAEGVSLSKSAFLDELTSMALAGVEAVKSTLKINSPSRVFRELGNFTGLGFVTGLADYAKKSYAAGANVAEYAADGLSNAMSITAELLSGDMDAQPTIRPVLDLSDVMRGADELNSLFYPQRTIGLAGQASLAFAESGRSGGTVVNVDNGDIVEELRALRSEMAEMTERMERMRVVLDTGTLVGEMAGPMDNALGQRVTRRGRGN